MCYDKFICKQIEKIIGFIAPVLCIEEISSSLRDFMFLAFNCFTGKLGPKLLFS